MQVQKSPVAKHMGTRPANSKVQCYRCTCSCDSNVKFDDFVLHTGSKVTNGHAYAYSACQQQGIVLHVTVIQLIQCVVLFCVQMQNLDPVNMDEENAEVTNSLEVC